MGVRVDLTQEQELNADGDWSNERYKTATMGGQRSARLRRPENQPCGWAGIARLPAARSDTSGPAAVLNRAECQACGGRYTPPWRRRVG